MASQDMSNFRFKHLNDACLLIIEGIKMIKKISELIKWMTNLHANEGRPMTKSVLLGICRLVEILKCFQYTVHNKMLPLTYVTSLLTQQLKYRALNILANIKVQ